MTTAMAAEIAEIPAAAHRALDETTRFRALVQRLSGRTYRFAVICGRGSSGHVGVYLRYLIETRLGLAVAVAAPSVLTAYGRTAQLAETLFIVVSQSGQSPDLVGVTQAASAAGAMTVAIVNDPDSTVARAALLTLPLRAGRERSVAATKTVVASMVVGARLVAALSGDTALHAGLAALPDRLAKAQALDWSPWGNALATARAAYVAGRGFGLGVAREIALKLGECLRLPAFGYSAAELRHGPRAAILAQTPVLLLRQADGTAEAIDRLAGELARDSVRVFVCGGPAASLPWIGDDHAALDPIAMLVPAYRAIEAAARHAGLDPDHPPHLSKVTQTL